MPSGAEVRVVSASVIAQLQAQGLQVRFFIKCLKLTKYIYILSVSVFVALLLILYVRIKRAEPNDSQNPCFLFGFYFEFSL